jgi:hypothetical protein
LSWRTPSSRRDDLYVHLADQKALNARIDQLLVLGIPATETPTRNP